MSLMEWFSKYSTHNLLCFNMEIDKIYLGDCLELMKEIPDGSVDAIICDLPYGTTACAWDSIIPFDKLWEQYKRIAKPHAPILLFGSEPFSTMIRMSNLKEWRYDWIWKKNTSAGFVRAKNRPLKNYEIISAFCQYGMGHESTMGGKRMPYNPLGLIPCHKVSTNAKGKFGGVVGSRPSHKEVVVQEWTNYPTAVLEYNVEGDSWHPTQKPVNLLRYLIATYSNEGDTILDNCIGSGTTAIACIREHRHFIGFEQNKEYFDKAQKRIQAELLQPTLF